MPTIVSDWRTLSRVLSTSLDPQLRQLLIDRIRQLDVEDLSAAARFVIVQAGNTLADLDQVLGFPVLMNSADGTRLGDPDLTPGWEWIEDHGHTFEIVFIFTDDGFAHVVFVPRDQGVDARLLDLCEKYAGEQLTI